MAGCQRGNVDEWGNEREKSRIGPESTTAPNGPRLGSVTAPLTPDQPPRSSPVARFAAAGALALALIVVALVVLRGGSSYTLSADFQNASGLVNGDNVLIGPAAVGTISSIGLSPDGEAVVRMSLHSDVAPLHQGTVARIYEDSLSGIASKYVELEPGAPQAPQIASGGTIDVSHTYSAVNIDELFDTFDPLTRAGLSNVIRGEAASLKGKGALANQALKYLAPGLQSTSQVTAELTRDQPAFDDLLVQGAQAMQTLASRSSQLSALISNTSQATGAIAGQSQALEQTLGLAPATLRRATTTLSGLNGTLDALDPLVAASKPAVRRLPQFAAELRTLIAAAIPTVGALDGLIRNPSGSGDLTTLARATPALASIAGSAFPEIVRQFTDSAAQIAYLRDYAPDLVAALTNIGQASAYYDANGHYARTQPALFPFTIDSSNQLQTKPAFDRYQGLQSTRSRCPGSAVQPTPDGSAPQPVPGCDTSSVPSGP